MSFDHRSSMKWDVATAFSRGVDSQWKNYTKANFLAYDKQASTAGQVQGLKGSGFQIKTVCTFREMVWKSLLGQPQIKQSCQALFMKISKHQLSVVPHQQGHAAFVAPICRIWSYSSCRQWEGKKKFLKKLVVNSPSQWGCSRLRSDLLALNPFTQQRGQLV